MPELAHHLNVRGSESTSGRGIPDKLHLKNPGLSIAMTAATSSGGAVILLIYSQSDSLLYLEYQVNNQNGRFRLKKKLIKRKIYNKNT